MPASKNTWNKGLNSDYSKLKSQQDSYLNAKNIRVMTDKGSSTFAIENIRGNEFSFDVPKVEATYQLDVSIIEGTLYIDIIRDTSFIDVVIQNVDRKSNEFITDEINTIVQNFQFTFPGKEYIKFYYNSKYIVAYDFLPQSVVLSSLVINAYTLADPNTNLMEIRTNKVLRHTILGWGYYNDTVVLITCEYTNNEEEPSDKEGFIWAATYDNATNTIQAADIDGQYLNPNTTLKYAGILNLSRQYAIYKHLKCRYENNYTARVVWTDNYNNLRTCNVLDPQIFATPPELFSYIPIHAPQKPVINILIGGTLPTAKYQYFYQLSSNQGAISTFSPISNLMFAYTGDSIDYGTPGNPLGTNSNKSMQIYLQNLDTNYDTIRVGYIVYQVFNFPEAFFFDERAVPDNGQLTVVHNGGENDVSLDETSIANLNRTPEIFKTIDVVRNRLFAANARTTKFDLTDEFDARAYRYNSNGIARLYNIDDTYSSPSVEIDIVQNKISIESNPDVSPIDYTLIPENFDCINPFNQEKDSFNDFADNDWFNNAQFKYQKISPVPIIGGKGLNISYQFVTKDMTAKVSNFPTANKYIEPGFNYAINYTYEFSDTYSYPGGQGLTMDTLKNPLLETLFTGYSRGEVYRFGIVFYDVYGYPSYPLWIGDIKFPFAYEEDDIGNSFGLTKLYNDGALPPLNENAQTQTKNGNNLPTTTGGSINIDATWAGDYVIAFRRLDGIGLSVTLFTYNPGPSYDIDDITANFNAAAPTHTDPVTGETATIVMENYGPDVKFRMSTNASVWLGYAVFFIRQPSGPFPQEVSVDFEFYGSAPGFSSTNGTPVILKQLGITFSLDTSGAQFQAIKDRISGYSYVRLKREAADSTRLGTGCIQPTFQGDNKYLLTPYEWNPDSDGPKWGFDLDGGTGSRVRLGIQTYYTPNIIGGSLPGFAPEDYFRFIARTNNYGLLIKYAATITAPDFGDNKAYYVASNDFNYYYSDPPTNPLSGVLQRVSTNSYLATNNKFPIEIRVNAPYSTNSSEITIGPNTFINMANANFTEGDDEEFSEWGAECIAVKFPGSIFPDTTVAFDNNVLKLPFYLVAYERYLTEQYKGWTRADRYSNEYILTNHFQPIDGASNLFSDVYGGDTYVNYFDWQKTNPNYSGSTTEAGSGYPIPNDEIGRGVAIFFPAEATFNTDMNVSGQRAAVRQNTDNIFQSNYQFNSAYSQQNTNNVFISKAYLQSNVIDEPHTIYPSEPKLDGEVGDSWRSLLINNALSVNGNYGEINRVVQFKDKLFFYQNDGVGIASVDERVLANEADTTQTQLGTGTVLQRFDYISTETGCKHSFAVESTGSSIYHYDSFINKLFKYAVGKTKDEISGMNPLTDVKGLSGFFRTAFVDSNIKSEDKILRRRSRVGIVSSFNSEYNTVYFTFFDQNKGIKHTISYNELLDSFESFYDFYPSMYLNMRKRFLSVTPLDTAFVSNDISSKVHTHNVGIRNTFYGEYYPSSVTFRVNENSDFVKTFDNFQLNTEVILDNLQLAETVSRMSITNDYQNYPEQNVNFVQKIRSWRLAIPRDETNPLLNIKPRISDKYIDVTFTHNPLGLDKTFRLHDVITEYSMRSKIVPSR